MLMRSALPSQVPLWIMSLRVLVQADIDPGTNLQSGHFSGRARAFESGEIEPVASTCDADMWIFAGWRSKTATQDVNCGKSKALSQFAQVFALPLAATYIMQIPVTICSRAGRTRAML